MRGRDEFPFAFATTLADLASRSNDQLGSFVPFNSSFGHDTRVVARRMPFLVFVLFFW